MEQGADKVEPEREHPEEKPKPKARKKAEPVVQPKTMTHEQVIAQAINLVKKKAINVPKTGYNAFHKYAYMTETDLLAVVRPAMVEVGLELIPSISDVSPPDEDKNVTVTFSMKLIHAPTGAVWPHPLIWAGVANDRDKNGKSGDKALYKALTGGMKYFIMKLFLIGSDDDPENEKGAHPAPVVPPNPRNAVLSWIKRTFPGTGPEDQVTRLNFLNELLAKNGHNQVASPEEVQDTAWPILQKIIPQS